MQQYYVYMHTNKINNKKYIGITSEEKPEYRWKKGYSHNKHFEAAIQKYGWDNFKHEIIASDLSKSEAEDLEIKLVSLYQANNPDFGYNLTSGGGAGVFRHSEESKRLMSEHSKGELNPMYGKHHSEQTRQKITKALQNHSNTSKRVLCIETGQVFPSTREVGRAYNISHSSIGAACRGEQKTAKGYHWQYISEEEYQQRLKEKEYEKNENNRIH